jgi:hypothetical protein
MCMSSVSPAVLKVGFVFLLSGIAGIAAFLPAPYGDLARAVSTIGLGALAVAGKKAEDGPATKP